MNDNTKIEWCDATLNPLGWGCFGPNGTPEKPARCSYCYAHRQAKRKMNRCDKCNQFVPHGDHVETEMQKLVEWKRPRRVFVQSMGDLFGMGVDLAWIDLTMNYIRAASRQTCIVLTKCPTRARAYFQAVAAQEGKDAIPRNLILCVSASRQEDADERLAILRTTPVWWRGLSLEPMLGPVDLAAHLWRRVAGGEGIDYDERAGWLHWVIVGGLTLPGAKQKAPNERWTALVVAQTRAAAMPVFVKDNAGYAVGWASQGLAIDAATAGGYPVLYQGWSLQGWPLVVNDD